MKYKNESGFSLIELLLVVVIIGIVAAMAVPAFQKALIAAENRNLYTALRAAHSTQTVFSSQKNRFGRLDEINNLMSNQLGNGTATQLTRGKFVLDMVPAVPTDADLKLNYTITATRNIPGEGVVYQYSIDQSGKINRIFPSPEEP